MEPHRGGIVVFESVEERSEDLIKRVVGGPGDTISVRRGKVLLNGEYQREAYVNKKYLDRSFSGTVPKRRESRELARLSPITKTGPSELSSGGEEDRGRGLLRF